jgi:hypothetical protein
MARRRRHVHVEASAQATEEETTAGEVIGSCLGDGFGVRQRPTTAAACGGVRRGCAVVRPFTLVVVSTVRLTSIYYRVPGNQNFRFTPY